MAEKESDYGNYEELPKINKFVGESFGTDNVRTVYAGESRQIPELESRVIILVGPMNAGKTSLIDFMCNLFYGAQFDSNVRYKIANEKFDATTPTKSIIKYVFNGTKMSYRPIVIDTPGIGHPSGIKTNVEMASHISEWLYFDPRSRIHAVGLVIPSFIHSITAQMDSDLQLTLSMFPEWMRGNIVPLITYSEGNSDSTSIILRHFNLHNNTKFRLNTSSLYAKPSQDPIQRHLQQKYWELTVENLKQFFEYVSILHPQCMEERLPPWETSRSPIPPPLPQITNGDLSDSGASEAASTPRTVIERKKFPNEREHFPYSPPPTAPPPPVPLDSTEIRAAPPLPPRIASPTPPRKPIVIPEKIDEEIYIATTRETAKEIISSQTSPITRHTETTTTTIRKEREEEIEQTIRPSVLPLGIDERRSQSALDTVPRDSKESDIISIKRYTYDPISRSYKMQSIREQKVYHASSSSRDVSRSREVSPMPAVSSTKESLYERITAEIDAQSRRQQTFDRSTKINGDEKVYKETHINGFTVDQSPTKESTSTDTTPTSPGLTRAQYDTSVRSSASEWLYSPSRASETNGVSDNTLPKPDLIRPQVEETVHQTTILHYDTPPLENPPRNISARSYENVYELPLATDEINARNETITRAQSRHHQDLGSTLTTRVIMSGKTRSSAADEAKQPSSPTREPLFERNTSSRQSLHSSSFKRARRAANNAPKRPDTDYDDNWDSDIESGRVPLGSKQNLPQPIQQQPQQLPHTQLPRQDLPPRDHQQRQQREPSPPRHFHFPPVDSAYTHSPHAPLINQSGRTKQVRTVHPVKKAPAKRFLCITDVNKIINMCFLVCIPIFIVVVLIIIILLLIFERN